MRGNMHSNDLPRGSETMLETSLYNPVKRFLEGLGFAVKGEIGGCDLLALSRPRRRSSWCAN